MRTSSRDYSQALLLKANKRKWETSLNALEGTLTLFSLASSFFSFVVLATWYLLSNLFPSQERNSYIFPKAKTYTNLYTRSHSFTPKNIPGSSMQ